MKSDGKGNKWHTGPTGAQQYQSVGISGWPIMSSQSIPRSQGCIPLRVAESPLHTHTFASAHPGDSEAMQVSPYMYYFNLSFSQGRLLKTSSSCSRFTDTNMASPLFFILRRQTDFRLLYLTAYLNKHALRPYNVFIVIIDLKWAALHCILRFWSDKLGKKTKPFL